ncbi:protein of unknown function [Magnetospirillum sp. XM-1]|uniref:hypothetical protein n=1 Tax=Magnetospirillum sp. XM-1 TaxID=1663591 RepID=UPI00073DC66D|nr:hypothetical protein [Magnetospirillum sp. XM-1]CUW38789.1 protein of unknown function [Magnetospirillum sp. XM-1]
MELANCFVRLGGEIGYEVRKTGIPLAEILLLQSIHGADAVVRIERAGSDDRKNRDIVDYLKAVYGDTKFRVVFPGTNPSVHVQFRDIVPGEDVVEEDEPQAPVRRGKKPVPGQDDAPAVDPTE